jgi:hypothetical protein
MDQSAASQKTFNTKSLIGTDRTDLGAVLAVSSGESKSLESWNWGGELRSFDPLPEWTLPAGGLV